jgi:hypothetical protein
MTRDFVTALREKGLNKEKKDKEARLLLFEYAMYYQQTKLFHELAAIGFAPALKQKKDYGLLERKYFMGYSSSNTATIFRQVALYGIDFRTTFNQTPLMTAAAFGNTVLVSQLLEKGANVHLTDNFGRNTFQIVLQKALLDRRFSQEKLAFFYAVLSPDFISLKIEGKLIKLDVQRTEFFMINAMIATAHHKQRMPHSIFAFNVNDFLEPLNYFPDFIMSERRKKRAYLSSILSKHEVNRQDLYNRKLFLRVKHGHYILNPDLMIKIENDWMNIYDLLNLEQIKEQYLDEVREVVGEVVNVVGAVGT